MFLVIINCSYNECFPLRKARRTLLLPLHPDGHLVWRRSFIRRRRSILPVCVHPGQNCCHTGHIWPGAGGAGSWVVYRVQTRSQIWPNIVILFIKTSTVGLLQNIIKAENKSWYYIFKESKFHQMVNITKRGIFSPIGFFLGFTKRYFINFC